MGYMAYCDGKIEFHQEEKAREFVSFYHRRSGFDFYNHAWDTSVVVGGFSNYHENFWTELLEQNKDLISLGLVEFKGEDRNMWRFVICNGEWQKEYGHIVWTKSKND